MALQVCKQLDAAADAVENVTYEHDKAAIKAIFDECIADVVKQIDDDTATDATFVELGVRTKRAVQLVRERIRAENLAEMIADRFRCGSAV